MLRLYLYWCCGTLLYSNKDMMKGLNIDEDDYEAYYDGKSWVQMVQMVQRITLNWVIFCHVNSRVDSIQF